MIIQSKFRDYYDPFASGPYRDPKIVYKRVLHHLTQRPETGLEELLRSNGRTIFKADEHHVGLILIAGKLYPVHIAWLQHPKLHWSKTCAISYEDPYEKMPISPVEAKWAKIRAKKGKIRPTATWGQTHPEAVRLNRELGPIIFLSDAPIKWKIADYNKAGAINPKLSALKFPMEGHQIVQNIMGFLGAQDPKTVATTDKDRAQAHGLDKTSFRKDKGGPTRKSKPNNPK